MSTELPLFALNTVVFPGVATQLHVFEERYRALVAQLLTEPDPTERVFGVTAIREGYEVGAHGVQSLHTVGTVVQLTNVEHLDGGRFDIEIVGRQRFYLQQMLPPGPYPAAHVELLEETPGQGLTTAAAEAIAAYWVYRDTLNDLVMLPEAHLPDDPLWLSWTLAEIALLTLPQRQELLASDPIADRLNLLAAFLHAETRAMTALPSLPAIDVARTRWSPN